MTLKTLIKWTKHIDEENMLMEGAVVAGISCAHSSGMDEELWSFNTGNGRTHYFKTEEKFLNALSAHLVLS